jgi:long-chain acyl-CoA synthetase
VTAAAESLPAVVLRRARVTPDRVALRKKHLGRWRTYSWRDYAERVSAFAAGLDALGVGPGDRVAVLGDNRPAWVFADLGIQALGATSVGLDPAATAAEVAAVLRATRAKVLVAEDEEQVDKALEVRAKLPGLQRIVVIDPRGVDLSDALLMGFAELEALGGASSFDVEASAAGLDLDAVAVSIPGGADHTHRDLAAGTDARAAAFGVDERTEILSTLSLSRVDERLVAVVDAVSQGAVVSFGENLETFPQDLREVQPTIFHGPAVLWEQIRSGAEERMADAGLLKRVVYRWAMAAGPGSGGRRGPRYAVGWLALYRPLRQKLGLLRATGVVSGDAPLPAEARDWYGTIGVPVREGYAA